jgi:hypothetical protein
MPEGEITYHLCSSRSSRRRGTDIATITSAANEAFAVDVNGWSGDIEFGQEMDLATGQLVDLYPYSTNPMDTCSPVSRTRRASASANIDPGTWRDVLIEKQKTFVSRYFGDGVPRCGGK